MTYEERQIDVCNKCTLHETCGFVLRNMENKCSDLDNIMLGWELGQSDTIEEIEVILNKGNESRCDDFFTIAEITRKIEQLKK